MNAATHWQSGSAWGKTERSGWIISSGVITNNVKDGGISVNTDNYQMEITIRIRQSEDQGKSGVSSGISINVSEWFHLAVTVKGG